jgi:hypothetical protein
MHDFTVRLVFNFAPSCHSTGRTAINRLLFIASTVSTTELGRQALLTAIPIIKSSTLDTTTYTHAADLYIRNFVSPQRGAERSKPEVAAGNDRMDVDASVSLAKSPTSVMPSFGSNKVAGDANTRQEEAGMIDSTWLREASNQANVEKQKLDAELKQYLSNLIKESCRVRVLLEHSAEKFGGSDNSYGHPLSSSIPRTAHTSLHRSPSEEGR